MKLFRVLVLSVGAIILAGCHDTIPTKSAMSAEAMKDPVVVAKHVPYAPSSGATMAVKGQCIIDSQLPEYIESYASQYNIDVVRKGQKVTNHHGKVLKLEFVRVFANGGGAWSGAKSITVKGTLTKDGKVIGSFIGSRYSGGGAFGGFKGTCSILGRCAKALGSDIAMWLKTPTMNARLGDAR